VEIDGQEALFIGIALVHVRDILEEIFQGEEVAFEHPV
jgi:hypothetical protein